MRRTKLSSLFAILALFCFAAWPAAAQPAPPGEGFTFEAAGVLQPSALNTIETQYVAPAEVLLLCFQDKSASILTDHIFVDRPNGDGLIAGTGGVGLGSLEIAALQTEMKVNETGALHAQGGFWPTPAYPS